MISDAAGVARLEGRLAFGIAVPRCAPFVAPLLYAIPIHSSLHVAVLKGTESTAAQPGEERDGRVADLLIVSTTMYRRASDLKARLYTVARRSGDPLLDRHALRQVARLVDVGALSTATW